MTLASDVRAAYDVAGAAWSSGPVTVYDELARPLVEAAGDVAGLRVLDVGTGAGSVAAQLRAAGAAVVASDQSLGMLLPRASERPAAVVSDVESMPFVDGSFDLVTAGFVLNHLPDPTAALREAVRVGRRVVATTFAEEAAPVVKRALLRVAEAHGFTPPGWYAALHAGPLYQPDPSAARDLLVAAGLVDVTSSRVDLRLELPAEQVLAWRWGMAHLAEFVGALDAEQRRQLDAEARAVLDDISVLDFAVVVMTGQRS